MILNTLLLALVMATAMLWLERLYARLRLPFWVGTIVAGILLFLVALAASYLVAGLWSNFVPMVGGFVPMIIIAIFFYHYAARYARSRLERLREYADSMLQEKSAATLRPLYGLRGPLICWAIANANAPLYMSAYPAHYTLAQKVIIQLPWVYANVFLGTFVWTWAYSIFSIYRMGKLPLRLKPFAEDRALGLKPFATASLHLTAMYLAATATIAIPNMLTPWVGLPVVLFWTMLFLLGVIFFFLPLLALRPKLILAKQEAWTWAVARYVQIIESLKTRGDNPFEPGLVNELLTIKEIQRDIQQIRTWPFDTSILVRLAALVITVAGIMVERIITVVLRL